MKESKPGLLELIAEKMSALPQGMTPADLAKQVKEAAGSSLTERSVDDFLKIFKSNDTEIIERMTILDDEQFEDFFEASIIDRYYVQPYTSEEDRYIFRNFIDEVSRRYMSRHGRALEAFENIAAGRSREDVGLFKGIFNALTQRLFNQQPNK